MDRLIIYDQARTAHLERILAACDGFSLVYRAKSYDFDESLATRVGAKMLSRCGTVALLIRKRPARVELNEPLYLSAWPSIILYIFWIRLFDILTQRKTTIVSYAIENNNIACSFASYTKLPFRISKLISQFLCKILIRNYDRLAFGTPGALENYKCIVGEFSTKLKYNLFLDLDKPCPNCPPLPKKFNIIFIGSFETRKGILKLIEAWPGILEQNPGARIDIAGKGVLLQNLITWSKDNPSSQLFIDPSRNLIHELLNNARVLVMLSQSSPRWKEQVGLPILEGLSHGCEIVTTTDTGLAEWLTENGHCVISPSATTADIIQAISKALSNARDAAIIRKHLPTENNRMRVSSWLWEHQ